MKKFIGVIVILLTLFLTVIYRKLAGSRVKDKPGVSALATAPTKGHNCTLRGLREELPLFQLLIQ
ncbi:MAG TPA: hypothetical protein VK518_00535 [Puia sp.]|nr:hypothetical protein [Puia sp.]